MFLVRIFNPLSTSPWCMPACRSQRYVGVEVSRVVGICSWFTWLYTYSFPMDSHPLRPHSGSWLGSAPHCSPSLRISWALGEWAVLEVLQHASVGNYHNKQSWQNDRFDTINQLASPMDQPSVFLMYKILCLCALYLSRI